MTRLRTVVAVAATTAVLVGCAPRSAAPDLDWQPPGWPSGDVVELHATVPVAEWPFTGERLVNDPIGLHARFGYVPGVHGFNARIDELLWDAIDATGGRYAPIVADPGVDRGAHGCLAGSARLPAAQLVAEVAAGAAGALAVVVCDALPSFGTYVGQTVRSVRTAPTGDVVTDASTTLYADTADGGVVEAAQLWNDQAAQVLWKAIVDSLRRETGALTLAPVSDPPAEQQALVASALGGAVVAADGVYLTVPSGVTSPELMSLGFSSTGGPMTVRIPFTDLDPALSELGRVIVGQVGMPYQQPAGALFPRHPDCDLLACVALTYDDGPTSLTPQVIATLADRKAPATFYMTGDAVQRNPDVAREVAAAGHEIEGHTFSHPHLPALSVAQARDEVLSGAKQIADTTGVQISHFRPPYGEYTQAILNAVGLPAVLWDVDTFDWTGRPAQEIIDVAVTQAKPGSIILSHDPHANTVVAVGPVTDGLRARGFTLVTVQDLFGGAVPAGAHRRL